MLNDLLGSKSRAELWEVMRMLKDHVGGDRNVAKAFFSERPGLTKAVFQAQVLLGEFCELVDLRTVCRRVWWCADWVCVAEARQPLHLAAAAVCLQAPLQRCCVWVG